jgi:hypothetical protein
MAGQVRSVEYVTTRSYSPPHGKVQLGLPAPLHWLQVHVLCCRLCTIGS